MQSFKMSSSRLLQHSLSHEIVTVSSVARLVYQTKISFDIDIIKKKNGRMIRFKALLNLFLSKIFARHVKRGWVEILFLSLQVQTSSTNTERNFLAASWSWRSNSPLPLEDPLKFVVRFSLSQSHERKLQVSTIFHRTCETLSTATRAFVMLSTLPERCRRTTPWKIDASI